MFGAGGSYSFLLLVVQAYYFKRLEQVLEVYNTMDISVPLDAPVACAVITSTSVSLVCVGQ